jgi:isoleucyl-tRNA synthetase
VIYQKIQNFCTTELGGFYLDIIKDRQYTTQADSLPRRSCQTAMYHIVEAMSRWLAPILSFTAEEIWREIPGERGESVFLESWYGGLFGLDEGGSFDRAGWQRVIDVRNAVGKALEAFRASGNSSLDAEIDLYCSDELKALLDRLEDELRFVLITSDARVLTLGEKPADLDESEPRGLAVQVRPSSHAKCPRCWHHREDVGANSEHPELCGRCVENVTGTGEARRFA